MYVFMPCWFLKTLCKPCYVNNDEMGGKSMVGKTGQ